MVNDPRKPNEPRPGAYVPISDYAIIGDCRSAALVSRAGSIDWLCWPRFDSPSVFAAILDDRKGGRFWVRPTGEHEVSRRYLPDTAVLETTFTTSTGVLELLDLMPMASEEGHEILRTIECVEGEVELEIRCEPRPQYGRCTPRIDDHGRFGLRICGGEQDMILHGDLPLAPGKERTWAGWRGTLRQGERRHVSLALVVDEPMRSRPLGTHADRRTEATVRWWHEWSGRRSYDGVYRAAVLRSAITLRLLSYVSTGAMVAAPTTSLPEEIGGVRNWDYRFCWIRDTSLTIQALYDLGCLEEAEGFLSWLLQITSAMSHDLHVVYDVNGRRCRKEHELTHLEGYRGSRPVRVGNAAGDQFQLDIFGEVVDAVHEYVIRSGELDAPTAELLIALGHVARRRWHEPDEGIWEVRSGRRHHTHSKVMCWVALDRILHLHELGHLEAPCEQFREARDEIRRCVEEQAYDEALRSYTSELGGDDVDASLLLLVRYGFSKPDDERARGTFALIEQRLGVGPLIYRYRGLDDGLPGTEGAFGICSFWAVEILAEMGELEAAAERFEQLLGYANDVGLFAEEIDATTGEMLGNFPQAFTHVGLLDAALALHQNGHRSDYARHEEPPGDGDPGES